LNLGEVQKMQWKDPAVPLTNEDIRELIREDGIFDNWLKYYKKLVIMIMQVMIEESVEKS
jgi:hypothetical protein